MSVWLLGRLRQSKAEPGSESSKHGYINIPGRAMLSAKTVWRCLCRGSAYGGDAVRLRYRLLRLCHRAALLGEAGRRQFVPASFRRVQCHQGVSRCYTCDEVSGGIQERRFAANDGDQITTCR